MEVSERCFRLDLGHFVRFFRKRFSNKTLTILNIPN